MLYNHRIWIFQQQDTQTGQHKQRIIKPKTVHNLLSARLYNWNWSPFTRELRLSEGDQTKLNIDIDALPFLIRLPRYVVTQIWWDLPINQIWLKYFNRTRLSLPAQPRGERSRDLLTTYWIVRRQEPLGATHCTVDCFKQGTHCGIISVIMIEHWATIKNFLTVRLTSTPSWRRFSFLLAS